MWNGGWSGDWCLASASAVALVLDGTGEPVGASVTASRRVSVCAALCLAICADAARVAPPCVVGACWFLDSLARSSVGGFGAYVRRIDDAGLWWWCLYHGCSLDTVRCLYAWVSTCRVVEMLLYVYVYRTSCRELLRISSHGQ